MSRVQLFVVLALVFALSAPAQTTSSSITGSVVDPSGQLVVGASVKLTNESNGEMRAGVTNETGGFAFHALVPGPYTVRVDAQGFRPLERKSNMLLAAARLDLGALALEVGSVSESVTVTAQGVAVQTTSSNHAAVLDNRQMAMISLRGRDPITMLRILPGVQQGVGNQELFGGDFATPVPQFQGRGGNTIYVDGVNGGDGGGGGNFSGATNIDAIAEVNVQLGNYTAEYGLKGGSQINFVTKRGGSEFHGTGYWYKRHEMFNATNFFNNLNGLRKPIYRVQTLGGNIGGPVPFSIPVINPDGKKLNFFYSIDDTQTISPSDIRRWTMPTELERRGDFSQSRATNGSLIVVRDPQTGQPFPNNIIPQNRQHPLGVAMMNLFPLPNGCGGTAGCNFVVQHPSIDKPRRQHLFRIDYRPTDKDTFSFKGQTWYTKSAGVEVAGRSATWGLVEQRYDFTADQATLHWTRIISPNIVNEFMTGVFYSTESGPPVSDEALAGIQRPNRGLSALRQFAPQNNPLNLIPRATFSGLQNNSFEAAAITYDGRWPIFGADTAFPISNNLTWTRGAHAFKGGVLRQHERFGQARSGTFSGEFRFQHDANDPGTTGYAFANAYIGHVREYTESMGRVPDNRFQNTWAFFVQDTWRASRRLTIDVGLRMYKFGLPLWGNGEASAFTFERFDPNWGGKPPVLYRPTTTPQGRRALNPLTGEVLPVSYIGLMVPGSGYTCGPITPTTPCQINGIVVQKNGNYVEGGEGFFEPLPLQFDPRVGVAWDVFGDHKMAIRASVGAFHDGTGGPTFKGGPAFQFERSILFTDLDTYFTGTGATPVTNVSGARRLNQKRPVTYNYMFGIQRELGWNTVLDVAYVGSNTHHISRSWNYNQLPMGVRFRPESRDTTTASSPLPDVFLRPILGFGDISISEPMSTARYDSLQVQANRRFSRGLEIAATYTWAGGTENNIYQQLDSRLRRERNTNVQPHVFNVSYIVDIPRGSTLIPGRVSRFILDNWQVSGITTFASGFPLNVSFSTTDNFDFSGGGEVCGTGIVQTGPAALSRGERSIDRWFDTSVFRRPSGRGDLGNNCNNAKFIGPGFNNHDISVFKNFPVSEGKSFQLRWEMYNAFNHTQFGGPNADQGVDNSAQFNPQGVQTDTQFGRITAARQERRMQLSLRFNF
jgi:hypothetical protein